MLLATLACSLLGSGLTGREVIRAGEANSQSCSKFLMPPHPLDDFEIQKYYQNEPKFNAVKLKKIFI